MVIKFKKLHTVSDKVYISFDNEQTWFEFDTASLANGEKIISFGKATNEERENKLAELEYFNGNEKAVKFIELEFTPEELSDIKIFGRNYNEVWTPQYSHQRALAYQNEQPETVYFNYEKNGKDFSDFIDADNSFTNLKIFNMYSDFSLEGKDIRLDKADDIRDKIKESTKNFDISSSILPPRKNYSDFFFGFSNLRAGPELPDNTEVADRMYAESSIKAPISLAGSLVSAKEIFANSHIKTIPYEFGDKLKDISGAFSNCKFKNTNLSDRLLGKYIENMSGSFRDSNITQPPKIPEYISNLSSAFERCTDLEILPDFGLNKAKELDMSATFRGCLSLGKGGTEVSGLPDKVTNLSYTFADCENLKYAAEELPTETKLAIGTFQNCFKLSRAPKLSSKVYNIDSIFYGCSEISNPQSTNKDDSQSSDIIEIPESVVSMEYSFTGTNISQTPLMEKSKNLQSIKGAFFDCPKLSHVVEINRFAPLKSILNAFDGKSPIQSMPDFPYACEDDLSWKFCTYSAKSLNRLNKLKRIGAIENKVTGFEHAFDGASQLTKVGSISLNNSIQSIDFAFQNCFGLLSAPSVHVSGRDGIAPSAFGLFKGCVQLRSVSNFVKASSLESAFEGCSALTGKGIYSYMTGAEFSEVPLPQAFDGDDDKQLYVNVRNMFKDCSSLREITFPRRAVNSSEIAGDGLTSVEIVNTLPENVLDTSEIRAIFSRFPNAVIVRHLPNVKDLSGWFTNHASLVSASIYDDNIVENMTETFKNCIGLRNTKNIEDDEICRLIADNDYSKFAIEIPKHVVYMGGAFANCINILEIDEIPASVQIAARAFEGCEQLVRVNTIRSNGDFTHAFSGTKVSSIGLISTDPQQQSIVFEGSGIEPTLISVEKVENSNIERMFKGCYNLVSIELSPNIRNIGYTFYGCKSLHSVGQIPKEIQNLDSAFENSGIMINDENYMSFFEPGTRAKDLNCTFKGCDNVYTMPLFENPENKVYFSQAFAHCENLSVISLNQNVEYSDDTFLGSRNISRCIEVPKNVRISSYIFDEMTKLNTIEKLGFNPSYGADAIAFSTEKLESLITKEGELLDVIDSAVETQNKVIYRVFGETPAAALENATVEAQKVGGKVVASPTTPKVAFNLSNGEFLSNYYGPEQIQYQYQEVYLYYRLVEVNATGFDVSKKKLSEYIDWLYENGYIHSTQYISEESVSKVVNSYYSKLGDFFPYLKEVYQISADNSSAMFACGQLLEVQENNIFDKYGERLGPLSIEKLTGKESNGRFPICTPNVSNISHLFFENTGIKYVGDIPETVTSCDKPFEGCTSLKEAGHIEASSLHYNDFFNGCTSLKTVGNIGITNNTSTSIENIFSKCESLESVGEISNSIEKFGCAFERCVSLSNISYLSSDTFAKACTKSKNIQGMFFKAGYKIQIGTDKPDELKQLFLAHAFELRNKTSVDTKTGAIVYLENDNGIPYSQTSCEEWVNSLIFVKN